MQQYKVVADLPSCQQSTRETGPETDLDASGGEGVKASWHTWDREVVL